VVKKADIGGKRLISLAPNAWVQWVTQRAEVTAQTIVGSEFQWISRENDILIQCVSSDLAPFSISEFQRCFAPLKLAFTVRARSARTVNAKGARSELKWFAKQLRTGLPDTTNLNPSAGQRCALPLG
jgi:hypothetical protein